MIVNDSKGSGDTTAQSASAVSRLRRRQARQKGGSSAKVKENIACPTCREKGGDSTGNHMMVFEDSEEGYCSRCTKKFSKEEVQAVRDAKPRRRRERPEYSGGYQSNYPKKLTLDDLTHFGYLGDKLRGIKKQTDEHFGIRTEIDTSNRKPIKRYYPYYVETELFGFKTRGLPKDWQPDIGTIKGTDLFGWHLCTGKRHTLIIVEGEEDCAAGWQMWRAMNARSENRRIKRSNPHIVSLPNGAKGLAKIFLHHIEELLKYDKIIWMGDNYKIDEDGARALEVAVQVLGVDNLHVAEYPEHKKDLCNIMKMETKEVDPIDVFAEMFFNAKPYQPADVIDGCDITLEDIEEEPIIGLELPFPSLEEKVCGMRLYEHTLMVSGSGMGKSTYVRALGHWMRKQYDWKIGNIYLEEKNSKTQQGYMAFDNNVALNLYRKDFSIIPIEAKQRTMQSVISEMMFLNHNGKIDTDVLISKIRYLYNKGCKLIILDHISLAVSGSDNERTDIDYLMEAIYRFCEHHPVHVLSVVHLNKGPSGSKDVNRGGEITPRHLLGSSGLMQMVWNLIALEGDNQHPEFKNRRYMRVLKTREGGDVGLCDGGYDYQPATGQIKYIEDADRNEIDERSDYQPSKPSMGKGKYDNSAS